MFDLHLNKCYLIQFMCSFSYKLGQIKFDYK